MSDLNTLTLQGRIARDAVVQTTKAGKQVALFTLAVNQTKKTRTETIPNTRIFFPCRFSSSRTNSPPTSRKGSRSFWKAT